MKIFDGKTKAKLAFILELLENSIETNYYFGVPKKTSASLDEKYVQELIDICNTLFDKDDEYQLVDNKALDNLYIIDKADIMDKIKTTSDKSTVSAQFDLAKLPVVYANKALYLQESKAQAAAEEALLAKFSLKPGNNLAKISDKTVYQIKKDYLLKKSLESLI